MSDCRHTSSVIAIATAALVMLSSSGVHGTVVIDPAQPVCIAGKPCSAPDRNDVLAFARAGRRVVQTRTDAMGHYRISLPPGRYVVSAPRHRGISRGLEPNRVVVPRGSYARVNFTLDIGIR